MTADSWWDCTHDGIGLRGCPTCDGRFPGPRDIEGVMVTLSVWPSDPGSKRTLFLAELRDHLHAAAHEIHRQRAEIAALRASLGAHPTVEPVGCPTPGACSCPRIIDPRLTTI